MDMNNRIILKTDASVNPSKGVGLGYEATIYNANGGNEQYTGSQYISRNIKTTKAEFIASIFAVREMYEKKGEKSSNYRLIVETDCERTARMFNHEPSKTELQRLLDVLTGMFESTTVRWISRTNNTTADSIARSQLERGWEQKHNSDNT